MNYLPAFLRCPLPEASLQEAARVYCLLKGLNPDESIHDTSNPYDTYQVAPRYLIVADQLRDIQLQMVALSGVSLTQSPIKITSAPIVQNEGPDQPLIVNLPHIQPPRVMSIPQGSTTTELRIDPATGNFGIGTVSFNPAPELQGSCLDAALSRTNEPGH